jgi:hypothetical protein
LGEPPRYSRPARDDEAVDAMLEDHPKVAVAVIL